MITIRHFRPFVYLLFLAASFLLTSQFSAAAAIAPGAVNDIDVPMSAADDAFNVELVGHLGGSTEAVAVQGSLAYIGEGAALTILDVSKAEHPTVVGKTPRFSDQITGVTVAGGYAYVTDGSGLRIINVADPAAPFEIGFYDAPDDAYDVAVAGDYAYVADCHAGLRIINVADPAAPFETGFYETYTALDVAVAGDYAYVADGFAGLRIINIADPAAPFEVSHQVTSDYAMGIAVAGDYAYVADDEGGLGIMNVADPATPFWVGGYADDDVRGVAVSGDYAYVLCYFSELGVINITDPTAPFSVGFYKTRIRDVAVVGDYAYVAARSGGLRVINVADSAAPFEAGFYSIPDWDWAYDVAVAGDYAYVATYNSGLRIVDVADPAAPFETGFCDSPERAQRVAVDGDYAYVVSGGDLRIINVVDPVTPFEAGAYDAPGFARDVAVAGDYAYVADYLNADNESGLRIVNVANPAAPFETGFYETPGHAWEVAVAGGYAYVADYDSGLRIINVSDPAAPFQTGFYNTPGAARRVAVVGDYAYVVDDEGGLHIINVVDPAAPFEAGFYDTPALASGVAVAGDYAYVVIGHDLRIINVADPAAPFESGYFETPDEAHGVEVAGGYAYQTDGPSGLYILRFVEPAARGHIIVDKETVPEGDPQSFSFNLSGGPDAVDEAFALSDASEPWQSEGLKAGTYSVAETVQSEWVQSAATCSDGSSPGRIKLSAGETVTCTFSNQKLERPAADFSASPTSGIPPLKVSFTNLSSGDYDECRWDFGDGKSSTICADPVHRYRQPGSYTVSLKVKSPVGNDKMTREDYITVQAPITADFNASPTNGAPPLTVTFANLSTGVYDNCLWDFGDGGSSTACEDLSHTYSSPGTFTASLTVEGPGGTDTMSRPDYITVYTPPKADFSASPTSGIPPLKVTFTNLSSGEYDECLWDFGDGKSSTVCADPIHRYRQPGHYTVSLKVEGPAGSDKMTREDYITVHAPITADFSASPTSGAPPLKVDFSNLSSGDYDKCLWDFGDGGSSKACGDPSYSYSTPGTFTVSLTVEGPGGTDTITRPDYIIVFEPPIADFIASPETGVPPLKVNFTNLSTRDFDQCLWDFGDGGTSNVCDNPEHTYMNEGEYTVSLTVKGPGGEDTMTDEGCIGAALYRYFIPALFSSS